MTAEGRNPGKLIERARYFEDWLGGEPGGVVLVESVEVARILHALAALVETTIEQRDTIEAQLEDCAQRFNRYVQLMHRTGDELIREATLFAEHLHPVDRSVTEGLRRLGERMKESGTYLEGVQKEGT